MRVVKLTSANLQPAKWGQRGQQPVKETQGRTDAREVMNIRQASEYLGVSPDTLYKYVGENQIPAFKLGNRWRFKKSKLDEWMEEQSGEAEGQSKRKAKARAAAH